MDRGLACSRRSISACRLDTVSMRRWRSRCAALLLPSRLNSAAYFQRMSSLLSWLEPH